MNDVTTTKTSKPKTTKTAAAATTVSTIVTAAVTGLTMPDIPRSSKSIYKFDDLEVGQCFGVVGKTKRQMANATSAANKKVAAELTDPETGAKTVINKHFVAFDVEGDLVAQVEANPTLKGSTVLIFRQK